MTRLLFALALLTPSATQSNPHSVPELLKAAYQAGYEDAAYEADNIGLVRLTLEDIEQQIGD